MIEEQVSLIGAGAVGSFAALSIAKMGVGRIVAYDDDGVDHHNLPNQFYRTKDLKSFKVFSLENILYEFTDATFEANNNRYTDQPLCRRVIVATDSMASRKLVWEQFCKQPKCITYIEARMGGQLGIVYTINKKKNKAGKYVVSKEDKEFYEYMLYPDDKVKPLPCTERSIIYNVLMLASLIARAFKSVVMNEKSFPREMLFNMTQMTRISYMQRI